MGLCAVAIAAVLFLTTPLRPFAATGTTVSVSAIATYKGTVSINGTVSPAPGVGSQVSITTKNPNGTAVDANVAAVNPYTGGFNYSFPAGGTVSWINGTYTVSAVWAASANGSTYTGTATFQYGAGPATTASTSSSSSISSPVITATTIYVNNGSTTTVFIKSATTTTIFVNNGTTTTIISSGGVTTVYSVTTVVSPDTTALTIGIVGIVIAIIATGLSATALRRH